MGLVLVLPGFLPRRVSRRSDLRPFAAAPSLAAAADAPEVARRVVVKSTRADAVNFIVVVVWGIRDSERVWLA